MNIKEQVQALVDKPPQIFIRGGRFVIRLYYLYCLIKVYVTYRRAAAFSSNRCDSIAILIVKRF